MATKRRHEVVDEGDTDEDDEEKDEQAAYRRAWKGWERKEKKLRIAFIYKLGLMEDSTPELFLFPHGIASRILPRFA